MPTETRGAAGIIDPALIRVSPQDALARVAAFTGRPMPITALTLLVRDGRPAYQAVGGSGPDSLFVDAQTGNVSRAPAPPPVERFIRHAHYFFFAGKAQTPLLLACSALAAIATLSGLALSIGLALKKLHR